MKHEFLRLMWKTGMFAPLRALNRRKALILTYHRFSQHSPSPESGMISADDFAQHLEYLRAHYHLLPLSQLLRQILTGTLPARAAAITIDDGYHDAYEIALPLLQHYNIPATVFVVTGFLDGHLWLWADKARYLMQMTPKESIAIRLGGRDLSFTWRTAADRQRTAQLLNELLKTMPESQREEALENLAQALAITLPQFPPRQFQALTWPQACRMDRAGVSIESHTVTHPILTLLNEARLHEELLGSRARLESELGREVKLFCYPNGNHDARTRQAVAEAGYEYAVTTEFGMLTDCVDVFSLRRIHAERDLPHFAQTTCGLEEMKERWRSQGDLWLPRMLR